MKGDQCFKFERSFELLLNSGKEIENRNSASYYFLPKQNYFTDRESRVVSINFFDRLVIFSKQHAKGH